MLIRMYLEDLEILVIKHHVYPIHLALIKMDDGFFVTRLDHERFCDDSLPSLGRLSLEGLRISEISLRVVSAYRC